MPAVHFLTDRKSIDLLPGTNLRKAALRSGIQLYSPLHRVFHLNLRLGPVSFPCASDVVEIVDGKGMNPRTPEEEALIAGRLLKRKVTPAMRLACQVQVNGDISVRTLVTREIDREATKAAVGYIAVIALFLLVMLGIFGMMALDMVKML
jgi:hypothetical protein